VKFKVCPFCSAKHKDSTWEFEKEAGPFLVSRHGEYEESFVKCRNCQARGPVCKNDTEAIYRWNCRDSDRGAYTP
jgi:hypothetical protein